MTPRDGAVPPSTAAKLMLLEPKDQWKPVNNIRSLLFLVVHHLLDQGAMRDALDRLIQDYLPVLGARIERCGKQRLLAYRLPKAFPDRYSLFRWTSTSLDSSLADTSLLPADMPSEAAFLGPASVPEMEAQWIPSDWPLERKHEKPDTPLLLVHLTSYTDATVVALNLPHAVADQMGYASVIRAWMQLLDGKHPTPFLELAPGQLDGPADITPGELRRKNRFRIMNRAERTAAMVSFIPNFVRYPDEVQKTLFLPESLVNELRCRLEEDLKAKYGESVPALTNRDVVAGTFAKLAHLDRQSPKMVNFSSSINLRGRHPALPQDQPYLHNAIGFAVARLLVSHATPLSEFAYRHRLAVERAVEPAEMERGLGVMRELCRRRYMIHICEPFELSYSVTNWCGAWRDIDLGPAVLATGRPGKVTAVPLVFGRSLERDQPMRFNSQIMSKSSGQGYWCALGASTKLMPLIEGLLKSDPQLKTL